MNDEEKDARYRAEHAKGFEAGALEQRARCRAIATHPEAEGRETLALHIACNTDMSPDDAVKVLMMAARVAR